MALCLALAVVCCGMPSDEDVRADFLESNPGCEVAEITSVEGDGSTVYKAIRYKRPSSVELHVVE